MSFPTSNFTIVIPRIEPPFKVHVYCVARVFVGVHVYCILLLILLRFSCCTGVVNVIFIRIVIFVLYLQTGFIFTLIEYTMTAIYVYVIVCS